MNILDWFRDEGAHIKNTVTSNDKLHKWHKDMDHWVDNAMKELHSLRLLHIKPELAFHPKIDLARTPKEYKIVVEIPGVNPKDLHLTINNHVITISGEKKSDHETEENHTHTTECAYGSFERVLTLPDDADMETIQAEFEHGVLHITVHRKKTPSHKKDIEIKIHK